MNNHSVDKSQQKTQSHLELVSNEQNKHSLVLIQSRVTTLISI